MPPASLPLTLRDAAAISRGKDVRRGSQVRKGETSTNQIRGEGVVFGSCRRVAAVALIAPPPLIENSERWNSGREKTESSEAELGFNHRAQPRSRRRCRFRRNCRRLRGYAWPPLKRRTRRGETGIVVVAIAAEDQPPRRAFSVTIMPGVASTEVGRYHRRARVGTGVAFGGLEGRLARICFWFWFSQLLEPLPPSELPLKLLIWFQFLYFLDRELRSLLCFYPIPMSFTCSN
ncbi:hypothetical protein AHAS_Ahas06G0178400 [Arachis hypogaea]